MSESAKRYSSESLKSTEKSDVIGKNGDSEYNWRVLIVEDEQAIAEGIKNIISPPTTVIPLTRSSRSLPKNGTTNANVSAPQRDKFEVTWAKNPDEALEFIKQSLAEGRPYAMGFFDVLLGGEIDGIELVSRIHQIDPNIYAVFVTAYHDRTVDSINQILGDEKSDRWDYMNKPFTDGAILQKARNAVSTWNLRTQKEKQDNQLAEAAKLLLQGERANAVAAVGRSVAHEFGNLLMQIIGNAEIALIKNEHLVMKDSLQTVLKAGETATSILEKFKNTLLGESKIEFKKVNIDECLNEAVDLMKYEFKKRNIRINRGAYDRCTIEANHHSLVQVFINVLINATYAMNESGQIDLSIRRSTKPNDEEFLFDSKENPEIVEVLIRDHGPGVPSEMLAKVMDPFFTTKGTKGTGLGLPICREIVEGEHNGKFKLENHPTKGVLVSILLPIEQEVEDDAD